MRRTKIPEPPLTVEQYREVLRQLEKSHANSMKSIAVQREVVETTRNELTRKEEIARLQSHNLNEVKYRRALAKLEEDKFNKVSRPPGPPSGIILAQRNTSLTLSIREHYISFEFLPDEDPEVFAVSDRRTEAEHAVQQFQCDEFNRLTFEDREMRIESHLQARAILAEPRLEANRAYMSGESRKVLQNHVLPYFMVIDRNTYTVRPRQGR